jgi:hypothetical protein
VYDLDTFSWTITLLTILSVSNILHLLRLEIYIVIPSTPEMMKIITQRMVEILSVLDIAIKVIKQGRMSE